MSKLIMTVDDSATLRKMVAFTVKGAGHQIIEAPDGVEALNVLQNKAVDLVITDLNMPNMDGLTLTRHLRSLPLHRTTPILLLTTESDGEKKAAGKSAGATGWIVKPFNQDQLLQVMAKVLPV